MISSRCCRPCTSPGTNLSVRANVSVRALSVMGRARRSRSRRRREGSAWVMESVATSAPGSHQRVVGSPNATVGMPREPGRRRRRNGQRGRPRIGSDVGAGNRQRGRRGDRQRRGRGIGSAVGAGDRQRRGRGDRQRRRRGDRRRRGRRDRQRGGRRDGRRRRCAPVVIVDVQPLQSQPGPARVGRRSSRDIFAGVAAHARRRARAVAGRRGGRQRRRSRRRRDRHRRRVPPSSSSHVQPGNRSRARSRVGRRSSH